MRFVSVMYCQTYEKFSAEVLFTPDKTRLCFSGYGSDVADFAAFKGIDNTTLTNVGVSNETDGYQLFVGMQLRELTQKLNKRALAE